MNSQRLALATLALAAAACQFALAASASAAAAPCPAATLSAPPAGGPAITYPTPAVALGPHGVTVKALVKTFGAAGKAFVRFGESPGYGRCNGPVPFAAANGTIPVSVALTGLIANERYHFEVGVSSAAGTAYGRPESFTAPEPLTVPARVSVGPILLGGTTRSIALKRLQGFLAAPLRFTFDDAYWSASRALLGAQIHPPATLLRALGAKPGSHLQLDLTVDEGRLRAYLVRLEQRFAHPARSARIRLVGSHAVVVPAAAPVQLDLQPMAAAVRTALDSGLSERLRLIVNPVPPSHDAPAKAVVIRLGRQTLTAYQNGRPVLTTPVTTGRPALPTPVGSYHIIFRASPFVFISPWPRSSPYWYPPTPVTWAMEFFDGDFLHNDPAEPTSAFGSGSDDGPYASHGCVHVPYSVMAYLYRWLPVGSQVVVAQT